ncbi:YoaK family protein [Motilimonas pumila]|uniref:DUF1275 domain-containing protein n=1 Tax=Motilimonas pumila TaxID=2303987 RepID=A0A418YG39_9GAMM|nr:YoaK family protein [Motilimonas pumila]RJG48632.1 DUF1275 domain-containing protein [Motilimonas pumila]
MISTLPKWVETGAWLLAFIAGFINAIGLLSFEHQSVSHLSGTATLLGAQVITQNTTLIWHLLGVLLSFVIGAAMAGLLLSSASLKLGRHYDTALMLESLLLFAALWQLNSGSIYGHFLASAACGLQNALATTYSGAIIRTTHVTGIFTDLGIMLGKYLKGEGLDKRKAKLFLCIISGFIIGGALGAGLFKSFGVNALLLPASICGLMALVYRIFRKTV